MTDVLDDLKAAILNLDEEETGQHISHASLDFKRASRKGVPEIIYAESKLPEDTIRITQKFLEGPGRAVLSRISSSLRDIIVDKFKEITVNGEKIPVDSEDYPSCQTLILRRRGVTVTKTGGRIGIITAGTSDVPRAEEAGVICREMGCTVTSIYDVGVAGLHRLFRPLQTMLKQDVDVIIVAAGMDGALPSVLAGLVKVPVIGLPTSVGYGHGGRGEGALTNMLQSCAPGLVVVNIDNGVGAGATAALTANRMALYRGQAAAAIAAAAAKINTHIPEGLCKTFLIALISLLYY